MENLQIKVDQVFAQFDHTVSPGCALAVIKDGEIIYKRGYGMAQLEYGVPISPSTIFHIASISKHFTALAVTLLAHDGKLSLEDDVRKHIPELPDFGETITLHHLIYHTSGLRDQWELLIAAGWRMADVITMDDILDMLSHQKELNFKPGEKYLYCNSGYTLLAFTVQRVSGKSFREFCEERMFKPLEMTSTHFHDDHRMVVPRRAYSYAQSGYNQYINAVLSYANVGATSLFTTVEDMALWDREFYEGRVFGKAVIDEMHTLGRLNNGEVLDYAYGLRIATYHGLKIVEHSGGDAGFRTQMLRFPEQHFSVVVFSNLGNASTGELANQVADLYLAESFTEEIKKEETIELSKEELEKFVGLYYSAEEQAAYFVELKEGKLVVLMGPGIPLEALAKNEFRLSLFRFVKLTFEENESGIPGRLYVDMGSGSPETFEKAQPAQLSKEDMETYTGMYTCPELDVAYTIAIQEEKLVLKRRKYPSMPLQPTVKDGFIFSENALCATFTRDEEARINGFLLSTGRVKNLRFVRQSS